jgi:hypothetical protein
LRDFLTFHLLFSGASETVFEGCGVTGSGLGDGSSITGALAVFFTSGFGMTTVLAAGLAAGADAGGPGNDTKLTLIDPGENKTQMNEKRNSKIKQHGAGISSHP